MGWTAYDKAFCVINANGSINKKKTMDHETELHGDLRVVKSMMSGGNWYAVVEHTSKSEYYEPGTCFLAVCLISVDNKAYGEEFAYKDMSDKMGPYQRDCPKVILDLADELCPCTDEYDSSGYARKWRADCRENLRIKNLPTAFKNVRPGESVLWHVPEESRLVMDGESIAGKTMRLTKVKGRRSWIHKGLWSTRIPTKYVSPKDCELEA